MGQEVKMDKKITKWLMPLIVLLALSLIIMVIDSFVVGIYNKVLTTILTAALLFVFGMFLGNRKKRRQTWLRKLIISFVLLLIVGKQLNWIEFNLLWNILNDIGINAVILNSAIIYCGWAFFD